MRPLFLLLLIFASYAFGGEPSIPRNSIARVVTAFGNALGCEVHLDRKNIVRHAMQDDEVFVILYSIDLGCSGGSAMSRPAFAVVTQGAYGRFFVRPEYSSPLQTSNKFPTVTYRLYKEGGLLRYLAKGLADTDALCCPSIPVEGQVVFRDGVWKDDANH